ncbi:B56-domain-containing protein [Atractiella rhizophila]|nr:B56-domain-containing protein [Atractiella rhizophila]
MPSDPIPHTSTFHTFHPPPTLPTPPSFPPASSSTSTSAAPAPTLQSFQGPGGLPPGAAASLPPSAHLRVGASTSNATSNSVTPPAPSTALPRTESGTLPRKQRSSRYHVTLPSSVPLSASPSLWDVPPAQRPALMVRKMEMCCTIFDFENVGGELEGKRIKGEVLREVVDFFGLGGRGTGNETEVVMREEVYAAVVNMFATNLFRPLPPPLNPQGESYDPEEDEPVLELAWTHLSLVFELFLRFLEREDFSVSIGRRYIDQNFVARLLDLFDSEDPRERDFVKTNLHRIYLKIVPLRSFIRRSINNIFHRFVGEVDRHNGIAELLEILGSIINGFGTPLKQEHKIFLSRVLLPLHKSPSLPIFYPQLSYCLIQFLEKDPGLHTVVFDALLRYWPRSNSTKEVLFLKEVEEILSEIDTPGWEGVEKKVFGQIARCLQSQHFQVAEQTLYFFNNEMILKHVADHIESVLPIIFPPLFVASRSHWNPQIHMFAGSVLSVLADINPRLVETCSRQFRDNFIAYVCSPPGLTSFPLLSVPPQA